MMGPHQGCNSAMLLLKLTMHILMKKTTTNRSHANGPQAGGHILDTFQEHRNPRSMPASWWADILTEFNLCSQWSSPKTQHLEKKSSLLMVFFFPPSFFPFLIF